MSKVLPKDWEAPDHLPISSRKFLVERAERINKLIEEKNEIVRNVEAAYYFRVGQALLSVKRKFKSDPEFSRWFKSWVEEATEIGYQKAYQLTLIAEKAEKNPTIVELSGRYPYSTLYQITAMPEEFRNELLVIAANSEKIAQTQIESVRALPEYEYSVLQEKILSLHATIAKHSVSNTAQSKQAIDVSETALNKALIRMAELKSELDGKSNKLTTQELILKQLNSQIKQTKVQVEELLADTQTKKNRSLAQTVNDANKGLDLLLSALDRFAADKPDLADHAIQTIERKLAVLKKRLYAT